jgi:hypothetical protein
MHHSQDTLEEATRSFFEEGVLPEVKSITFLCSTVVPD